MEIKERLDIFNCENFIETLQIKYPDPEYVDLGVCPFLENEENNVLLKNDNKCVHNFIYVVILLLGFCIGLFLL